MLYSHLSNMTDTPSEVLVGKKLSSKALFRCSQKEPPRRSMRGQLLISTQRRGRPVEPSNACGTAQCMPVMQAIAAVQGPLASNRRAVPGLNACDSCVRTG